MTVTSSNANELVVALQTDPSVSYWLRDAATKMYVRDPVDALRDAKTLLELARLMCGKDWAWLLKE